LKITILLPYKENFSPEYAGAVSLMVKDTCLNSKYKKNIKVVGYTKYKKKFNIDYHNINLNKKFLFSTTKEYLKKFILWEKTNKSDIIEIHNRPEYLNYIFGKVNSRFVLYFHNDPLTIKGSKTSQERIKLLNKCSYIVVISKWIKNQFIKGLENDCEGLMYKFLVIPHSVDKPKMKPKINAKKKCIVFVGRLNHQKGYDLFGKAIIKILNEFKDWKAVVAGDEPRQKIFFTHKKLKLLGFIKHNKILDLFEKSSIAVVPSRWKSHW
jgi:Glycosyltransferase